MNEPKANHEFVLMRLVLEKARVKGHVTMCLPFDCLWLCDQVQLALEKSLLEKVEWDMAKIGNFGGPRLAYCLT